VAKIGGGKLNGHFATPMLALVNIVAIIYSLFSMYAAAYRTKRASPEEFAALAAKHEREEEESSGGGRFEGDSCFGYGRGTIGQTTLEWEDVG
jgi:hypothetical protein